MKRRVFLSVVAAAVAGLASTRVTPASSVIPIDTLGPFWIDGDLFVMIKATGKEWDVYASSDLGSTWVKKYRTDLSESATT